MTRKEAIKHFEVQAQCDYAPTREAAEIAKGGKIMERMTWKCSLDGIEDVCLRDGVTVGDAVCRLADYEDTGLTPEEAADLQRAWDMYGGEEGITAAFQKAAERDAAVEELRGICWCCAHGKKWDKAPALSKMTTCEYMPIQVSGALARGGGKCRCPHWEWRGPQKEG